MLKNNLQAIKSLAASRYKDVNGNPFVLTDGQAEIFEIIAKRKYPRTHCITYTQYGKTDTVSMAVLTRITTFAEPWAIVAPSNKKAGIMMGRIIDHIFDNEYTMSMFEVEKGDTMDRIRRERNKSNLTFKFPDGRLGRVFTISSEGKRIKDLLDALMGFGAPNVVLDESSLVDDIPYAGIFRMLGGHKDNFLFEIGNAMRRNHFHKTMMDPSYHHINIDYRQGMLEGRITKEFIEEMRKKAMFDQLYENKFPAPDAVDTGGFAPLYIEEFLSPRIKASVDIFGEQRLGVDVAGEGSNYSVIVLRGLNGARVLYKEHNPDTMNFVTVILQELRRHPISKLYVDKVGIGKGVYDRLSEIPALEDRLVGVNAGESSTGEDFYNKRAEMFWRQREWLQTAELEGDSWADMLDVRYKIQSDKKIKIKSKIEMAKEGVQSPDVADALSLTFYDAPFGSEDASVSYGDYV